MLKNLHKVIYLSYEYLLSLYCPETGAGLQRKTHTLSFLSWDLCSNGRGRLNKQESEIFEIFIFAFVTVDIFSVHQTFEIYFFNLFF